MPGVSEADLGVFIPIDPNRGASDRLRPTPCRRRNEHLHGIDGAGTRTRRLAAYRTVKRPIAPVEADASPTPLTEPIADLILSVPWRGKRSRGRDQPESRTRGGERKEEVGDQRNTHLHEIDIDRDLAR
jgi:hypothetical protein